MRKPAASEKTGGDDDKRDESKAKMYSRDPGGARLGAGAGATGARPLSTVQHTIGCMPSASTISVFGDYFALLKTVWFG
jgi:hypothetical protein